MDWKLFGEAAAAIGAAVGVIYTVQKISAYDPIHKTQMVPYEPPNTVSTATRANSTYTSYPDYMDAFRRGR